MATSIQPVLKWPGGKRSLLQKLEPFFPPSFSTYFEPFVGGGAVFFHLTPSHSFLADTNRDLMNCYQQVRDFPEGLISKLSTLPNSEADYYTIRAQSDGTALERAARLLYLSNLSFNGIHRVNLRGEFNVPYGHKTHLPSSDPTRIRVASEALQTAELLTEDFESVVSRAASGDFVYFDPPYTVAHENNGFVKYNAHIFSWNDQRRLARTAEDLRRRGCHVVLSNASHPSVRELYPNFSWSTISRFSRIAASSQHRREIHECVFYTQGGSQ